MDGYLNTRNHAVGKIKPMLDSNVSYSMNVSGPGEFSLMAISKSNKEETTNKI